MAKSLCESRPLTVIEADAESGTAGTLPVVLIDAGWGSSGYYSEAVLKNAAAKGVFGEGLQMYLDHPGSAESYDRPERSVRDLVAVLATGGQYDETAKAVVAEARPMGANAAMLEDKEFLKAIGLSIRAYGDATIGEAEGRKGQIITELTEAISVDFVTKAGRGGRVLVDLMESARPEQVVERAVAHGVQEATANDTRRSLQDALTAQYGGEKSWVWVRDFDESTVWFQYETPDGSGTYELSYELDANESATLGDTPVEVRAKTTYVPINAAPTEAAPKLPAPAGKSTATESKETNMATTQIEESRLATLESAAERVQTLESENASLRRESAMRDARDTARTVIAAEAESAGVSFSALETEGLLARVTVGENGFDEAAYRTSVQATAKQKAESASATQSTGLNGFGLSVDTTAQAASSEAIKAAEAAAAGAFGRKIGA